MSNDTDYQLEFSHDSYEYLGEVLRYLQTKKERWDNAKEAGKGSAELLAELGLKNPNEVVSWGFEVTGVTVRVGSWANENCSNIPISGDRGELADLQEKFPELEITGSYKDEYTYGSVFGCDLCEEGSYDDDDENEEDETEVSECLELDVEAAQQFLEDPDSVNLADFTSITDDAAEVVSKYHGRTLFLFGLTNLTDAAAEALSKHHGSLELGGLTNLSDATADALSKHQGDLELSGLTELSDTAAEALSKLHGGLNLSGLVYLSDVAVESLSKLNGDFEVFGLTALSDKSVEFLCKHKGSLYLSEQTEISVAAVEALSKYHGAINNRDPADWAAQVRAKQSSI